MVQYTKAFEAYEAGINNQTALTKRKTDMMVSQFDKVTKSIQKMMSAQASS